jgi:hypothetical protein
MVSAQSCKSAPSKDQVEIGMHVGLGVGENFGNGNLIAFFPAAGSGYGGYVY